MRTMVEAAGMPDMTGTCGRGAGLVAACGVESRALAQPYYCDGVRGQAAKGGAVQGERRYSRECRGGCWVVDPVCLCPAHSFCLRWDWGAGWGELPFGQPSFGNAP